MEPNLVTIRLIYTRAVLDDFMYSNYHNIERKSRENRKKRTILNPKISLNKLGELLTCSPSRRRRILMDQKYPSAFIVARYTEAEDAISNYYLTRPLNTCIIDKAIKILESKQVKTVFEIQKNTLCIEALDSFYDIAEEIDVEGCMVDKINRREKKQLMIENVAISVRPELLLSKKNGSEFLSIGAIKLYFSKTYPLDAESGAYISSVVLEYLKTNDRKSRPTNKLCYVVDVFARKVFTAPTSYKRRLNDIGASCLEIAALWPSL